MGLFSKNDKKNDSERNEIENKVLKEALANAALNLLVEGEDYEDLAYTTVTFGYLFDIDDHGFEALFKVVTDINTHYFAVQGTRILQLNFDEETFQNTTNEFLSLHQ
uniref:hypothetical protein n=1 Tax=Agathobacter sp. TaxID=2021311 RepID=UPI004055FEC4